MPRRPVLLNQIADSIERKYLNGPNSNFRLPTEQALAQEFGVSRGTLRAVIKHLISRRVIYRDNTRRLVAKDIVDRRSNLGLFYILISSFQTGFKFPLANPFWLKVYQGIFSSFYGLRCDFIHSHQNTVFVESFNESFANHFAIKGLAGIAFLGIQPPPAYHEARIVKKWSISIDHDATANAIDSICLNNIEAGRFLANRLRILGHQNCIFIHEFPDKALLKRDSAWDERFKGFSSEFRRIGGREIQSIYVNIRDQIFNQTSTSVFQILRKTYARPSAIILPDLLDSSKWQSLIEKAGLKLRKDVSIFGFGDIDSTSDVTSVRFSPLKLGEISGRILRDFLSKPFQKHNPKLTLVDGGYFSGNTHGKSHA